MVKDTLKSLNVGVVSAVVSTIITQILIARIPTYTTEIKFVWIILAVISLLSFTIIFSQILDGIKRENIKILLLSMLRLIKLSIQKTKIVLNWFKSVFISWAKFLSKRKLKLIPPFSGIIIGFVIAFIIQSYRHENIKPVSQDPPQVNDQFVEPETTNAIIFNANDIKGSEARIGKFFQKRIIGFTYTAQYDWWLRTTYQNTIIVYIKTKYKDQAVRMANILDGIPIVIAYSESPFVGLEERDIAIFTGNDLKELKFFYQK